MKKHLLFIIILLSNLFAQAQTNVPYFGKINWLNGYDHAISGESIGYFSIYPDYATEALLTRATDGKKVIEWETSAVPKDAKGKYVYFSWVSAHSTGTSSGDRNFDLFINDEKALTFTTVPKNQKPVWSYASADSTRIVFEQKKLDGPKDAHGIAYLRIPLKNLTPGKPVKLKVVGHEQNSNDWYMTFKFSFNEKVEVTPVPFLLKNGQQSVMLSALHFGAPKKMTVKINDKETHQFNIIEGMNTFDIPVDAVNKPEDLSVKVYTDDQLFTETKVVLQPVVKRNLYFIHHSHTDIGYSHLQPEVVKIHNKNIHDALDMIEKTRNYPSESRFKWNIESLWVVENYLKIASPEQKEKFFKAVKEGSISLSALYANILTGLSEPEEMFHYTDYAKYLSKEYGLNITTAMASDVPGFAWTTVTALAQSGVKYFSSGPNFLGETHPFHGDRVGYFVKTWGDKPVWWQSPSGDEKVLFWAGAKGYSSWHGTESGGIYEKGRKKIANYLNELTAKNYPYDMVHWRYNIVADNGPIDTSISQFVKEWNEKYESPKIILSTTEEMFKVFEEKYGNSIPTVKGDITPYWEDGAQSTAEEEGKNRINSLRLQQLTTLYSMIKPNSYPAERFDEAWKNIILFHEHTWGAHNSIATPDVPFVTEQWDIKKQFMLDADSEINQLEKDLLEPLTDNQSNKIAVFNTSSWPRSGVVKLPSSIKTKALKDSKGLLYPVQMLSTGESVFYAKDIPALGKKNFETSEAMIKVGNPFIINDNSLSNGKITLTWDKTNGSIIDLKTNSAFNYAGSFNQQGLNSFWYVPGLDASKAVSTEKINVELLESGPIVTTVKITGEAEGTNNVERKITLNANSETVFIENLIDKKSVRTKESVHFGFPFNDTFQSTLIDAGYGTIRYLKDQLPGSNMDYLYARRWIDNSSKDKGIQLMLLQTGLIEPAQMIDERLTINNAHKDWKSANQPTSNWFSYVMNNYWHTNYKADQGGISYYNYALRPHTEYNASETEKQATEFTQPLIAIPIKETIDFGKSKSLFTLSNPKIIVTSVKPLKEGGYMIRIYNPESTEQKTSFDWQNVKPTKLINQQAKAVSQPSEQISLSAMGVVKVEIFVR